MTGETAVSVSHPNCTNITKTYCFFTPDYLSPCHKFNITVIPQNGAGMGESSYLIADELGNNYSRPQPLPLIRGRRLGPRTKQ